MAQTWLNWTILLIIGFPLLMLILGEVILQLERRRNPFVNLLIILRNLILPFLALFILLNRVMELQRDSLWVRLSETFLWMTLIYLGITVINQVLFEEAEQNTWRANVPKLFLDLSRTFVVLIGAAIVFSNVWGADLGGLLAALGVGSLVIGLALQDSLGNIFSGIALLFEQPIALGDWVQIGDVEGEVIEITWRSVHVYTYEKHLVVVPNAEIAQGSFKNYSRPEPIHGVSFELGFSYDDPPTKVIEILRKTALETTGVLQNPPPKILLVSYGDFAINYKVRFFVRDYVQGIKSKQEFNRRIWYIYQRYGLSIPYPIEAAAEYISKAPTSEDLQQKAIQTLQKSTGWTSVNCQALSEICQQSIIQTYGKDEIILKEKSALQGLFVILEGEVELSFTDHHHHKQILAHLKIGDIFGEKAFLLSNQISDVTVIALQDTQLLIIKLETLQTILQQFPLLASTIGEIMELRRQQINTLMMTR